MGLWDAITGRREVKAPNLDSLFMVPSAAVTLQAGLGYQPTGSGAVCYRAPGGAAYEQTQAEILQLLGSTESAPKVKVTQDSYGFTWLMLGAPVGPVATEMPEAAMGDLCTGLHAVNTTLEANGFADGLLCTLVVFADPAGRRVGLVYLYKQGTFYPFVPVGHEQKRDNLTEITIRDAIASDLPIEADMQRWLAVWGAPGL